MVNWHELSHTDPGEATVLSPGINSGQAVVAGFFLVAVVVSTA